MLGDHLGSTSITTDTTGAKVSEMSYREASRRDKPWGEMRFTTANATLPTRYTFTGQYSYVSDDATDLGNAGFGLMFYNARWYDPAVGRFVSADTIVPGGVQGLDRYSYTVNNPVRFTDPSGHRCIPIDECDTPRGDRPPDYVDPNMLAKTQYGLAAYQLYLDLYNDRNGWWWDVYGADGHFSAWDFIALIYGAEVGAVSSQDDRQKMLHDFQEVMTRNSRDFCAVPNMGCNASTLTGAFMHMSHYSQSVHELINDHSNVRELSPENISDGLAIMEAIRDPGSLGHPEWNEGFRPDRPYGVGNRSVLVNLPRTWLWMIPGGDPFYIFNGCQSLWTSGQINLYNYWGCTIK